MYSGTIPPGVFATTVGFAGGGVELLEIAGVGLRSLDNFEYIIPAAIERIRAFGLTVRYYPRSLCSVTKHGYCKRQYGRLYSSDRETKLKLFRPLSTK